ncbi:MAG: GrpB family protein, partial [Leptospiraceae bacterium]|nr:GrpB family protein [Leptospiraceae bacterium]
MIIFLNDLPAKFLRNKHEAIFESPAHTLARQSGARHIPGRAGSEGPEWLYRTIRSIRESFADIILIHEAYDHWAALHTVREGAGVYDDETYAFECLYPENALLAGQADANKHRQLQIIFERRRTSRLSGDMGFPVDASSAPLAAGFIHDILYERIELVPYQADWPQRFEREKQAIFNALKSYRIVGTNPEQSHTTDTLKSIIDTLEIHHTGSTDVAGMSAKNIIDMLLVIPDLNHFRALIAPLRACDY